MPLFHPAGIVQQNHAADTQGSTVVTEITGPDPGSDHYIRQPLVAASGPGRRYNSAAVLEGHVGNQLLPLAPAFAVDDRDELAGLLIELVGSWIEARCSELPS